MNLKRILVPVDFSEHSEQALATAEELARKFGAELHVLHSYSCEPPAMAPYAPAIPPDYLRSVREAATEHLRSWCEQHASGDLVLVQHLSLSPPGEAIADGARELDVDLIVMGTRGLTGLKHVLLGSVAERTVRTAECPVLTLK